MSKRMGNPRKLVEDIFSTRDDEMQCDEAGVQIARSADAGLSDKDSKKQYPALWQHFRFCPDCWAEYQMVKDLARLTAEGRLEQPSHIPPMPGEVYPPARVDRSIIPFPGFSPMVAATVARGTISIAEPIEIPMNTEGRCITLDVSVSEQDPHLRDLFCTVVEADPVQAERLEGSPVWLHKDHHDGAVIHEKTLNELGDVSFMDLPQGTYALRLHIGEQTHIIEDITLP